MNRRIGPYTIVRELARGGMGVVYVARQEGLEREVALKLHLGGAGGGNPAADERARARFEREAQAVARLKHPHVIQIHDFGLEGGAPYLVMDLISGESLEARLERGPLAPTEAIPLLQPVVEAVAFAHGEGILHRDLKPANILLDASGRALLTDFGLARDLADERDRLTRSGQLLGTPHFMAPEVATGMTSAIDERSDIYALGAVLYEALVGQPPFSDEGRGLVRLIQNIVSVAAPVPSQGQAGIPPELDAIVLKCLEKEPSDRYQSAADLAADLARWREGEPVSASRSSELTRSLRRLRRGGLGYLIPALALALIPLLLLDRAFLAPARAAREVLAEELAWQAQGLRPALYGLDPAHPLGVPAGELRRRLEAVDRAAEQLGSSNPAAVEARAYLLVYLRLSEGERRRRRGPLEIDAAPGRPEVVLEALDLASEGDVEGARRLVEGTLSVQDDPALRRAQSALRARFEPRAYLAAGPGGQGELAASLLPAALRRAYLEVLGPGYGGDHAGLRAELARIKEHLAAWPGGAPAARVALAAALDQLAASFEALPKLGVELAYERLHRLAEASWHAGGTLQAPGLVAALTASLAEALAQAEIPSAGISEIELACEIERALARLDGVAREVRRLRALLLTVGIPGTFEDQRRPLGARSFAAILRHGRGQESSEDDDWLDSALKHSDALYGEYLEVYPLDPLGPLLPLLDGRRISRPHLAAEALVAPNPLIEPQILLYLRYSAGRRLFAQSLQGVPAREQAPVLRRLASAAQAAPSLGYAQDWRVWDLNWIACLSEGSPERGRKAFRGFTQRARAAHAAGGLSKADLAQVLLREALISGPADGEPLLREMCELDPSREDSARGLRAIWRAQAQRR